MLNTIVLIIPILFVFIAIEWYISYRRGDKTYTSGNLAMNMAIGAIDQIGSLFYFTLLYLSLEFVYEHFRLFTLSEKWYQWIIAYIVVDFLSYWYHRFSHRINILWAGHVTHHSSEKLNFSNGFRTSLFQGFNRIIFWSLLPIFGYSPLMLLIILKVSGLYDFLLHTKYVPKLGWLEKILVTPSHHRVHHGRNEIYIDKNYSSTFIIWDKLFGTFQEETEEVEYGIKGEYKDNNPFIAVGYYYRLIWQLAGKQKTFSDKLKLLYISPEKTASFIVSSPQTESKISIIPNWLRRYALVQIIAPTIGLIAMLLYKDYLSITELLVISAWGISSMAVGAMILNQNIRTDFRSFEFIRNGLLLAMGIIVLIQ
jgi:alkylglycerol monooxygenase